MVFSGNYRFLLNGKRTATLEQAGKLVLLDDGGGIEVFRDWADYPRTILKEKPATNETDALEQLKETLGTPYQISQLVNKKKEEGVVIMASAATKTAKEKATKGVAKKANGSAKKAADSAELNDCNCGCGEKTPRNFRPGHDARVHSWAKKVAAGEIKLNSLPSVAQKYIRAHQ